MDPKAQKMRQQQMMMNRPDGWLYGDDMSMYQSPDSLYFSRPQEGGKKVFGRDIFNNKSLTFEPVMNIATPQNYVLGPGDQAHHRCLWRYPEERTVDRLSRW